MGHKTERLIGRASSVFDDLIQPSRYKALYGGRGSGKSHFFAEAMVANAASSRGLRAVCIREVQRTIKSSSKRLIEDKIIDLGLSDRFDILTDSIKTPGGGSIIFQGMQDHTAESIKSLEGIDIAFVEESAVLSVKSLEMLRPTIRALGSELWFSWNPRSASDPVDEFFRGLNPPDNAIIRKINYDNNKFFPAELEAERAHDLTNNAQRYAHIWLGEYEPSAVNAIWTRQVIHSNRRGEMPCERARTLVAIDPAVSDTDRSDEHGIVVAAIGEDQRGYLLEDGSCHGDPHQWASRAVALFDKWDADAVVIEKNQGGDLCKYTLQTIRKNLPIIEVHATRGKHVRAEPISALYTLGSISHVGTFPELEDQLCKFTSSGYAGTDSPDRAEAAIWAFTELFPRLTSEASIDTPLPPALEGGWMG